MKKLKDHLHLYLGCEALVEGYTNRKYPFNYRGIINYQLLLESGQHYSSVKAIKPILRPLSDMTEEEAREGEIWGVWHDVNLMGEDWDTFGFSPHNFKHLLSKGFDLFGLIEAGLAIDKTTLKQSTTI